MSNISKKQVKELILDTLILSYQRIDDGVIIENKYFKSFDSEENTIKVGYKPDDNRGYTLKLNNIKDIKIRKKDKKLLQDGDDEEEEDEVEIKETKIKEKKIKKDKDNKDNDKDKNDIVKKVYSQEEQGIALKNAMVVKPDDWNKIEVGTRLSYYKTDGAFTTNVYFDHYFIKNFKDKQVSYLRLSNSKGLDKTYAIRTSIIFQIYKYIDAQEIRIANMVDIITNMKLKIIEMDKEMKDLDTKHSTKYKKLLQLIKQLHPNSFEK